MPQISILSMPNKYELDQTLKNQKKAAKDKKSISNVGSSPLIALNSSGRTGAMCTTQNTRAHSATLIVIGLLEHPEHPEQPRNY